MKLSSRGISLIVGLWALVAAGAAPAQESLDQGKTPAQLYAANCAICHKSPRGLSSAGGILGVENFLREHYTASREAAAAIAGYLKSVDQAAPPERKRAAKPAAVDSDKSSGKDKPAGKKSAKRTPSKPDDAKADVGKTDKKKVDKKDAGKRKTPSEAKLPKAKPAEGMETKPSEADKPQAKPDEAKSPDSKPAAAKPADAKPSESNKDVPAPATDNKKPD